MIFFSDAQGTINTVVTSPVYQGSNYANEVVFVGPFLNTNVVTVSFTLPNGVYSQPAIMTQTTLSGIEDLNGNEYNAWSYLIPSVYTEYSGTVTLQFSVTSGTTVIASASSSFTVQAGVPNITTDPPEDVYQQILSELSSINESIQTINEEVAQIPNIPIVTANPQTVGTEELTALQVDNTVYNVPNMEISFGNEPDPTAFPVNTMTIDGDKFRFVGEKGDPRYPSNQSDITAQTGTDTYISPSEVAFSVKTGLIAPGKANWTDEEKATARATLGINTNTDLLNLIYPIGSVYMSFNNVSPATFFGGTWEQIKDTFLLAVGDTYTAGQSGGEATHKLIINEMPNHAHTGVLAYEQTGYGVTIRPGETYALSGLITSPDYLATNPSNGQSLTNRNERLLHETTSVGNSEPHNNMPPYQTVYMWKRTA